MAVIYGKDLAVKVGSTVESTVDGWWIEHEGNLSPYVASNTKGGTGREGGNKDWTGRYRMLGAIPSVFPGDSVALIASVDGVNGYTGTARIIKIEWFIDIDAGDYINAEVFFGANGALTPGAAVAVDTSIPVPPLVKGLFVELDDIQQANVRRMRLIAHIGGGSLRRRYCVAESDGHYYRTTHDLDIIAQWQILEDDPAQYPALHALYKVEILTATTPVAWTIQWMRIDRVEPIIDRRDPGNPIGATITAAFDAYSGTMQGSVKNPLNVTKWPV